MLFVKSRVLTSVAQNYLSLAPTLYELLFGKDGASQPSPPLMLRLIKVRLRRSGRSGFVSSAQNNAQVLALLAAHEPRLLRKMAAPLSAFLTVDAPHPKAPHPHCCSRTPPRRRACHLASRSRFCGP